MDAQRQIHDNDIPTSESGESSKPTIVLLHGALEDASVWNAVILRLQRDGYPVIGFANPLLGVAVDAAYLRSLLDTIEGPVILVTHAYGGAVITQAGADDPKVKGLVSAASIMPAVGETPAYVLERFPGSAFPTSTEPTTYTLPDGTSGTYLLCQPDKYRSLLAADVPVNVAALMIATQRPINLAALNEPLTSAAWTSKPSWQIRPLQDAAIPVGEYKFAADRAHSHVIEVNSSHAVPASNPDVVADVIELAARAITK